MGKPQEAIEDTSYSIDSNIGQAQLMEAHQWITKSADQGFAPAKEAVKLFAGNVAALGNDGVANNESQQERVP